MSDNQKLILNLSVLFLGVLCTYKVPYDTYTIIQYMIRPIPVGNGGTLHLSGLVPLVLYFIGLRGLFRLERFAKTSKILLFVAFLIIVLPVMKWGLDTARTSYHWMRRDKLQAVDIVDASINLSGSHGNITIRSSLEFIDYSSGNNHFQVRMYLPQSIRDYLGEDFIEFDHHVITYGQRNHSRDFTKEFKMELADESVWRGIFDSKWHREDYKYQFYNEHESIEITVRAMY